MQIITHHNHHYLHTACLVCGHRFQLDSEAHDAYDDGEHLGAICDPCMQLSLDERRATMHAHAEQLRMEADELHRLADDFWQMTRTTNFIHVETGEPCEDQTPCTRCLSPEEWRSVVQQRLSAGKPGESIAADDEIPF